MIPKLNKNNPGEPKPLRNNIKLHEFVVNPSGGFGFFNKHKFRVFNRDGLAVTEYCRVCGQLRDKLGIQGKDQPYVLKTLADFEAPQSDGLDKAQLTREFSELLDNNYEAMKDEQ